MSRTNLDTLDLKILRLLSDNAKKPYLEIARECGVSGAAIHQRIQRMQNAGIIKGAQLILSPESIGYETCAYVGIYLHDPAQYNNVVETLRQIPEIVECHFTTGQYDIFIKLFARNNDHLLDILQNKIQGGGIARTETLISFKQVFNRPVPVESIPGR